MRIVAQILKKICTALYQTLLHFTAMHYTVLNHTLLHYTALHCIVFDTLSFLKFCILYLFHLFESVGNSFLIDINLILLTAKHVDFFVFKKIANLCTFKLKQAPAELGVDATQ